MANQLRISREFLVANLNPRTEKAGDDRVPAVDLKLTATVNRETVRALAAGLDLPLWVMESNDRPPLPFDALKLTTEFANHRVVIEDELFGDEGRVILPSCKINSIRIIPYTGETAEVTIRVQSQYRPEEQGGALLAHLSGTVKITTEPGSEDLFEEDEAA